jgi:hypothetical protein
MCQAMVKQLRPGGRFVALTINPHVVINRLPPIEKYQSGVTAKGPLYEGAPLDITMLTASGPVQIRDHYWSQMTYENVLRQAGVGLIVWHAMRVSEEGFQTYGTAHWQDYLNNPPIVVLEARK